MFVPGPATVNRPEHVGQSGRAAVIPEIILAWRLF
jgi:hypothetical protein